MPSWGESLSEAREQPAAPSWIALSNSYANQLLAVEMKHHPETGSNQGLSQFDALASQPSLADEDQERQETEQVLRKFKGALAEPQPKEVAQDLEIMIRHIELGLR